MFKWEVENGLPVYCWANEPEGGAVEQANNIAKLPFAFHHVALMPDTHQGYGMPIGGVLATKDFIIPNAVGVDIGCGVIALKLNIGRISEREIRTIIGDTRELIPMGFNRHDSAQANPIFDNVPDIDILIENIDSAKHQLGTLGGGNHFIEIQQGDNGHVWLMIHSGSRNLGKRVADYYNEIAKHHCLHYEYGGEAVKSQLAFLDLNHIGKEYLEAMKFCLAFAKANREAMMSRLFHTVNKVTGAIPMVENNIHHNYVSKEVHYGETVWVHRKGATSARDGQICLIPGSMGTSSYIGVGLGSEESFNSCSHGAGRAMSRSQANKTITEDVANKSIEGVVFGRWNNDYSESPLAYKDIEDVMGNQRELVEPLIKLRPLGVLKG